MRPGNLLTLAILAAAASTSAFAGVSSKKQLGLINNGYATVSSGTFAALQNNLVTTGGAMILLQNNGATTGGLTLSGLQNNVLTTGGVTLSGLQNNVLTTGGVTLSGLQNNVLTTGGVGASMVTTGGLTLTGLQNNVLTTGSGIMNLGAGLNFGSNGGLPLLGSAGATTLTLTNAGTSIPNTSLGNQGSATIVNATSGAFNLGLNNGTTASLVAGGSLTFSGTPYVTSISPVGGVTLNLGGTTNVITNGITGLTIPLLVKPASIPSAKR